MRDRKPYENLNDAMTRHAISISLGDPAAGYSPIFQPIGIPETSVQRLDFIISFWALNGAWIQELHWRRVNGKGEYATRVFLQHYPRNGDVKKMGSELIKTDISDDYPKVDGKVDWLPMTLIKPN